jgi:hypothetical protein
MVIFSRVFDQRIGFTLSLAFGSRLNGGIIS